MDKTCAWEKEEYQDEDAIYETECGRSWMFIEGNLKDNDITYCPFCGGKIVEAEDKGTYHIALVEEKYGKAD